MRVRLEDVFAGLPEPRARYLSGRIAFARGPAGDAPPPGFGTKPDQGAAGDAPPPGFGTKPDQGAAGDAPPPGFGTKPDQGAAGDAPSTAPWGIAWPELEAILPDGGFPCGVVELSSSGLAGATSIAARAVARAHAVDAAAYAAWIDPGGTLFGPGLARAGVDLGRLLVVAPPDRAKVARLAVKVASAFGLSVVDLDGVPGAPLDPEGGRPPDVSFVRRLAMAASSAGSCAFLLTDPAKGRSRRGPWPVTMRLEIARGPDALSVRVAKEPHARIGVRPTSIPFPFPE